MVNYLWCDDYHTCSSPFTSADNKTAESGPLPAEHDDRLSEIFIPERLLTVPTGC